MSTYWGYYCLTCKEESEHWLNRQEEVLQEMLSAYRLLKNYKFVYPSTGTWATNDMLDFLEKHIDHEVILINEYGIDTEGNRLR